MPGTDYRKTVLHFKKVRKHNAKAVAKADKQNAKSLLRCRTLISMFGDGIVQYTKIQHMQDYNYKEWYDRADLIIEMQKDLKRAISAKDRGEVEKITAEMNATHAIALAIRKKIELNVRENEILNKIHHTNAKALGSLV